jgi:hypothetical protein
VTSLFFPKINSKYYFCLASVAHPELAKNSSIMLDSISGPVGSGTSCDFSLCFYNYMRKFACNSYNSFAAFSLSDLISFSSSSILSVNVSTTDYKGLT